VVGLRTADGRFLRAEQNRDNDAVTSRQTLKMAREKKKILQGTPKKLLACMQVPKKKVPESKYYRSWFYDGHVNTFKWKRNHAYKK
jgi:hypothetical protein